MEKFVLSEMHNKNFSKAVNEIYLLTHDNKSHSPDYYKWYFSKSIEKKDILNYY